jgi:uncharacterized membrane protein YedE/YeeE
VLVAVGVLVSVRVGLGVNVGVLVEVAVAVAVAVAVWVGVRLGVRVAVLVEVAVGTGAAVRVAVAVGRGAQHTYAFADHTTLPAMFPFCGVPQESHTVEPLPSSSRQHIAPRSAPGFPHVPLPLLYRAATPAAVSAT